MSLNLQINTELRQANNPKIISQGKCEGFIEIIPPKESRAKYIDSWQHGDGRKKNRRIFVCDSINISLRPLIPYACGYIFRDGTNLSHFANILRQHHICACIDKGLWQWAINAANSQKSNILAEFVCGNAKDYTEQIRRSYRHRLDNYFKMIQEIPILLSVYDVQHDVFTEPNAVSPAMIGEKALSVNALQNYGFSVPKTLILNGINDDFEPELMYEPVWGVLQKIFPELEKYTGDRFMVRASLHADPKSNTIVSGMIKTASFQTRPEFEDLLQKYVRTFGNLRSSAPEMALSIVVQERISACIFGVVFTRLPWDYSSEKMIFDLTLQDIQRTDSGNIQVTVNDYLKASSDQRMLNLRTELATNLSHVLPGKYNVDRFYVSLSEFLSNSLKLQEHFMVPLDIEFAVTPDFHFFYMQFRHIYFM